jgi:hypothetical protein
MLSPSLLEAEKGANLHFTRPRSSFQWVDNSGERGLAVNMKQMNIVATACLGGIAVAFAFAVDFYPFIALVGYLAVLAYMQFGPDSKPKQPPAEPWYMK